MIVQSIIRKGSEHPVFCEDFMSFHNGGRYFIGAVFDGCSGGNESHFASSLFGKAFNQTLMNSGFISGDSLEERGKEFMRTFIHKLFEVKVVLDLNEGDMLTTFIMLVYDKVHGEALTLSVGDGIICCDGETMIMENTRFEITNPDNYKDMPDYIAYDLNEIGLEKGVFDNWYGNRVAIKKYIDPQDISISTDGIFTFNTPDGEIDIVQHLLMDDKWIGNKIMLSKKVNILKTKYKSIHKDDISIIRLVTNFNKDDKGNN